MNHAMRRRVVRWIVVPSLLLGSLVAGLTWYLNTVFLPGPARQWVATWLAEQTGRRVQMGALTFRVWDGVSIDQIIIFEDPRYGDQPFLTLDRITFSCLYLPLLRERRLIIPNLRLIHPKIHLARGAGETWNMEGLRCFHRPATPPSPRAPITVLLPKLTIVDGELSIDSAHQHPRLEVTLTQIDLRAMLRLPHTVALEGAAQWQTVPTTAIQLQGSWDLERRTGDGTVTARQFPLDAVRRYLPRAATEALRELDGMATVTLNAEGRPDAIRMTATVTTAGCRWQWESLRGAGDVTLEGEGTIRRGAAWVLDNAALSVQLNEVAIQAPAPWPTIEHLEGTVRVTPHGVEAPALTASVNGLPVRVQGTLTDADHPYRWQHPTVSVDVTSDAPLETLWQALAPYRTGGLASAQLAGVGQLHATLQGPWPHPYVTTVLTVEDGHLTSPATGPLEHLSGRFLIQPNLVTATAVGGVWRDQPVQLEGTLINFAAPEVDCTLRWGEIAAEGAFAVEGPRVTLTQLVTTYRRSRAQTTGEITVGSDQVEGTLYSEFEIDLAEATALLPATATAVRARQPAGVVTGHAFVRGPLREPRVWECGIKGHADQVVVNGIRFDNVHGEYRQLNGEVAVPTLTALCYGGALSASGTMHLDEPGHPLTAQITVNNLELGRLAKDTPWRERHLAGLVSGECRVHGLGHELPRSLEGDGRLQVTNGQLFEIPVLQGLADLLGAPALNRVTFRDAAGTFALQRERLTTSDLTFYSNLATLTARGSIGPAGAIDAHVVTSIDPTAFEHSPQFARTAGQFLHKAGYLIGEIKISGTLREPRYEVVPVSLNRLLKEQVFEQLRGVFEGLLR